jgi:hypothetical protein
MLKLKSKGVSKSTVGGKSRFEAVPIHEVDKYRLNRCEQCGKESQDRFTLALLENTRVVFKRILCKECFEEEKNRWRAPGVYKP